MLHDSQQRRAREDESASRLLPWACSIAEAVGVDGFDTWTPDFIDGELPAGTDAVLIIGD